MAKNNKWGYLTLGIGIAASAAIVAYFASLHHSVEIPMTNFADNPSEMQVNYKTVEAPLTLNENGVIYASEWRETYPEIVASMEANADNTYRVSYLDEDQDPYLKNIYEGYGFAKDYTSAIGHSYTLEDVRETERPHALANCLTCKTPDFTKLVNDMGEEAYLYDFNEVYVYMGETISCYNCHENQAGNAGELVVTHSYVNKALGDEMASIDPATLSCGQCHIEYYFEPETKATSMPYSSVAAMSPEAILAYYDELGFADWTQESTGTPMLKAQHPEMETFLGEGSIHAGLGMNCADCHMAKELASDGSVYLSHKWVSPLESESILSSCVECHGTANMEVKIRAIQDEITTREKKVGNRLSDLKDRLAEAVASEEYTESELDELRQLYRSAQWYFDFDYVENSEGVHNSALARQCLETSENLIAEAEALFKYETG